MCEFNLEDAPEVFAEEKKPETPKIKATTCKGFALVVARKKDGIATHTPQKGFFAVPADASEHEMKTARDKINKLKKSYTANKYDAEVHEFELPFPVSVVGGLTTGYCASLPKPLTAEKDTKKLADVAEEEDIAPKPKKKKN